MFKSLKDRAIEQANRLARSETGQRLLAKPGVQRAIAWASETSSRARENLKEARRSLSQILALEAEDDLEPLKREMERLERRKKDQR